MKFIDRTVLCFAILVFMEGCTVTTSTAPFDTGYKNASSARLTPQQSTSYQAASNPVDEAEAISLAARSLAQQISQSQPAAGQPTRIAVMPFRAEGYFAERIELTLRDALRAELFATGKFEIVADLEMSRAVEIVAASQRLTNNEITSKSTVLEVAQMVSAQAGVYGSISESSQRFRVMTELIDGATGKAVAIAQVLLDKCVATTCVIYGNYW